MSESPNTFDAHCIWLLGKMQDWEKQRVWTKGSKQKMNWHFRKEINKNTALLKKEGSVAFEELTKDYLRELNNLRYFLNGAERK